MPYQYHVISHHKSRQDFNVFVVAGIRAPKLSSLGPSKQIQTGCHEERNYAVPQLVFVVVVVVAFCALESEQCSTPSMGCQLLVFNVDAC